MIASLATAIAAFAMLPTVEANQLEKELLLGYRILPSQIEFSDQRYILPSYDWIVRRFIPFSQEYFAKNNLRVMGEGMDCDNLARLFRNLLAISNANGGKAGVGEVPCAVVKVKHRSPFGGVPGTGEFHSLILIRTDQGWHMIEPQTGSIASLAGYPNGDGIEWLLF